MYKKIFINSIIIFVLSSLIHFFYNSLPNFFSLIISPVNESIFEHQKMIFSSYMLYLLIRFLFFKNNSKNLVSSYVISALFNIVIFLLIYIPIYRLFKVKMIVTFIIFFITILISNYLMYKLQLKKENKVLNKIMGYSIIVIYLIFTLLSYFPLKNDIFLDPETKMYGVYNLHS